MNNIKLLPLSKPLFRASLQVRIYDLNYGNHLGNDSLVSLLHEARVKFFKMLGFTELDICGIGILITNLVVNYKAEAFYEDNIEIAIEIGERYKTGLDLRYELRLRDSDREIAKALTTVTFFDYKKSKIVKIPQVFLDKIHEIESVSSASST